MILYAVCVSDETVYCETMDAAFSRARTVSNRGPYQVAVWQYNVRDDLPKRAFACRLLNGGGFVSAKLLRRYQYGKLVRGSRAGKAKTCEGCGKYPAIPERKNCEGCEAYREHQA